MLSLFIFEIAINAIVLGGLWVIGMREFALFDMSLRFKAKYMLLGLFFAVALPYSYKNLKCITKEIVKEKVKRLLPVSLFWIMTYAIFVPSSLFLGNIDDFRLDYIVVFPILLMVGLFIWCIINVTALCLVDLKWLSYYIALVFSGVVAIYVQGNFLNPKFPALDGAEINWSQYMTHAVISTCFWIVCIIVMQFVIKLWKQKAETVMKYASYFLTAVQFVSLIVLLLTTQREEITKRAFAAEGEFTVGTEENIILFVIDSMDASIMKEYLASDESYKEAFDDFTFFDNVVSGGAPTELGMPTMLTGIEYAPENNGYYQQEAWQEVELYDEMHEQGYDIRFYSDWDSVHGIDESMVENLTKVKEYGILDYSDFTENFYKLVNFYVMPQAVKNRFWLSTMDIQEQVVASDDIYRTDDVKFYKDFLRAEGFHTENEKTFRLYHLNGVHFPFKMDENAERIHDSSGTEKQSMQGSMKIVTECIEALKTAGVYDNSTIIIAGDHGQHQDYNLEVNPAVLVKRKNTSGEFQVNSSPVHFRNLTATMAEAALDDYSAYGPSLYDITEDSDVERMHTVYKDIRNRAFPEEEHDNTQKYIRYIIEGDAADRSEYRVYNPYEINRFSYTMGDTIAFTSENPYASNIDYRLYQENNTGIASNELTLCLDLQNYSGGDVEFAFTYADVYNNSQKIKVYAKGYKAADLTCTKDGIGQENTVVITEDCIEGGVLVLRMVFPNAVTPHQLDENNKDTRVLSVAFELMRID